MLKCINNTKILECQNNVKTKYNPPEERKEQEAPQRQIYPLINGRSYFLSDFESIILSEPLSKMLDEQVKQYFLKTQQQKILEYIQKMNPHFSAAKAKEEKAENADELKSNPTMPYYYSNKVEEVQTTNLLYLIEKLFTLDNLNEDFNLRKMLDRDGYASLRDLSAHPQIGLCRVTKEVLDNVFREHRENAVTETVETFDDILIRNRNWNKFKRTLNDNVEDLQICTQKKTLILINKKIKKFIATKFSGVLFFGDRFKLNQKTLSYENLCKLNLKLQQIYYGASVRLEQFKAVKNHISLNMKLNAKLNMSFYYAKALLAKYHMN